MPLLGQGVMAIWNDITPEGRAMFYEWHPREHMPERLGIPGFRRGRRYIGIGAAIEFLTLYETASAEVLVGDDYRARLNSPTPWSKAATAAFRNNLRGVCRVAFSQGHADGAFLVAIRLKPMAGREAELERHLAAVALPPLLARAEVTGAHLCICDPRLSGTDTDLQRARRIGLPDWVVLIEGSTAAGAEAAGEALLAEGALPAHGADPEAEPTIAADLYRLEYSLIPAPT